MRRKYESFKCSCPYEFVLNHPFEQNSELFNRADCFVSAENPKYSGWNNTVAEAMACGLPVISTKAGTDDLLKDDVNGIRSARWVFCFTKHLARLYEEGPDAWITKNGTQYAFGTSRDGASGIRVLSRAGVESFISTLRSLNSGNE